MKLKSFSISTILVISCAVLFNGCAAETNQQLIGSAVKGAGAAYGSYQLTKNPSATYQANYKILTIKLYHLMDGPAGGGLSPADLHLLITQVKSSPNVTPTEAASLSFLGSVGGDFVQLNGGATPTLDGGIAATQAKQLALGLASSIGMTTGTDWAPDWNNTTSAPVPTSVIKIATPVTSSP